MVVIQLLAKHFNGTDFIDCNGCAIERAAKEAFPESKSIHENVSHCRVDGQKYSHEWYGAKAFDEDKEEAEAHNFDDTVIRELIFTEK